MDGDADGRLFFQSAFFPSPALPPGGGRRVAPGGSFPEKTPFFPLNSNSNSNSRAGSTYSRNGWRIRIGQKDGLFGQKDGLFGQKDGLFGQKDGGNFGQ